MQDRRAGLVLTTASPIVHPVAIIVVVVGIHKVVLRIAVVR